VDAVIETRALTKKFGEAGAKASEVVTKRRERKDVGHKLHA